MSAIGGAPVKIGRLAFFNRSRMTVAEVGGRVRSLSGCQQSYDGARMLVRRLQSSDQRVASDLLQQLGYDVGPTELAARINRVLADPTHFAAVAEEGSRIYGLVHAYERPALERAHEVVVQSLVVDQSARKGGIGRKLMTAAEAWAKSRGIEQVVLHTRIDRDDARSFYEHVGYNRAVTSHLMAKSLDRL